MLSVEAFNSSHSNGGMEMNGSISTALHCKLLARRAYLADLNLIKLEQRQKKEHIECLLYTSVDVIFRYILFIQSVSIYQKVSKRN
ncbi:hypothetical protein ATG66_1198 [Vibrio sp. ES.051]|nr:hypothetical protein ATG66_1198 [Vibrio sp. ES.051]